MQYADPRQQAKRIEELVARLESSRDPALLTAARELVQSVMDMHRVALERMMDIVSLSTVSGFETVEQLARDEVVSPLLVLHGLHPYDLETRVQLAISKLRDGSKLSGGVIELNSIEDGVVHVRLWGRAASLKKAITDAIYEAAPDAARIIVEGSDDSAPVTFIPVEMLSGASTTTAKSAIS